MPSLSSNTVSQGSILSHEFLSGMLCLIEAMNSFLDIVRGAVILKAMYLFLGVLALEGIVL